MSLKLLKSILVDMVDMSIEHIMRKLEILTSLLLVRAPNWRFPPGPLANWLPVFGSLPLFITMTSYKMLTRMAKKFGKIFLLKLGTMDFIVISDADLIREAFASNAVIGRSAYCMMELEEYRDLIHADSDTLPSRRAFVGRMMSNMISSDHVMHKNFVVRAAITIKQLRQQLAQSSGQAYAVEVSFSLAIVNIVFATLVGAEFSKEDLETMLLVNENKDLVKVQDVICFANWLPNWFPRRPDSQEAVAVAWRKIVAFQFYMETIVDMHRHQLDPEKPVDFIDAFLVEVIKIREGAPPDPFFTEPQLYSVLAHIFHTSLEAIVTTIHWLLLAVLKHPHIQENIHEELDRVVGLDGTPNLGLMNKLPYLQATILEALRFSTIMPVGIAHSAIKETTIGGYSIPKYATVVGLFWKIHRDPKLWKFDPNKFNPANHLNDRGDIVRSPNLMTFSTGQRSCLGDQVALNTLFLIFSNLFNVFKVRVKDGTDLPSLDECVAGMIRETVPFDMTFACRDLGFCVNNRSV